jgi:hypothetical protein
MICSLEKELRSEHKNMSNPAYAEIIINCPVLSRQICLWCCLHICDAANPITRSHAVEIFPRISEVVSEMSGRDLDDIFKTCGACRNR